MKPQTARDALEAADVLLQALQSRLVVADQDGAVAASTVDGWTNITGEIVHLATGREATAIGSALGIGWARLDPTDQDGVYTAPNGEEWIGCSDSVWRRRNG